MFDNLPTDNNKQGQGSGPLGSTNNDVTDNNSHNQKFGQNTQVSNGQSSQGAVNNMNNQPTPLAPSAPLVSPGQAKPIEDMFSGTEIQEKPAIFQAKTAPVSMNQTEGAPPSQIDPYTGEQIKAKNKTIVFALMLISLMLVATLGWYAYRVFFSSISPGVVAPVVQTKTDMPVGPAISEQKMPADLPVNNLSNSGREQVSDTDGDGLSDEEELSLGTNSFVSDTDGDGLFDREEVKVYETDPLDADTDKDGYADGMEVDGGYNPNGEGSLYNIE